MKPNEKIRQLRKSKGISQTFIAKKLNISTQAYSMKETGDRPIKTDELVIIADSLDVSPSYFFEQNINVKLSEETA